MARNRVSLRLGSLCMRCCLPAVHRLTHARSPAAAAMAAKATTRAASAQAPAKSMRQLNKENEDLQAQVDQLTSSLQSVHAGKQAVKASYEVCAQAKLGVAHGRAPLSPRTPPRNAAPAFGNHRVHARGFRSVGASPPSYMCVYALARPESGAGEGRADCAAPGRD